MVPSSSRENEMMSENQPARVEIFSVFSFEGNFSFRETIRSGSPWWVVSWKLTYLTFMSSLRYLKYFTWWLSIVSSRGIPSWTRIWKDSLWLTIIWTFDRPEMEFLRRITYLHAFSHFLCEILMISWEPMVFEVKIPSSF